MTKVLLGRDRGDVTPFYTRAGKDCRKMGRARSIHASAGTLGKGIRKQGFSQVVNRQLRRFDNRVASERKKNHGRRPPQKAQSMAARAEGRGQGQIRAFTADPASEWDTRWKRSVAGMKCRHDGILRRWGKNRAGLGRPGPTGRRTFASGIPSAARRTNRFYENSLGVHAATLVKPR